MTTSEGKQTVGFWPPRDLARRSLAEYGRDMVKLFKARGLKALPVSCDIVLMNEVIERWVSGSHGKVLQFPSVLS